MMELKYRFYPAASPKKQPCLVFLHGLLGDHDDWQEVRAALAAYPCLLVDLPGHGLSHDCRVADFGEMYALLTQLLTQTGSQREEQNYCLIGYSLGGRIALGYALQENVAPGLCGLVVEGANPGLIGAEERAARAASDAAWAKRFASEPMAEVLADWYRQPVFADLPLDKRAAMIARRARNDGAAVAAMLTATSLSRQPDYAPLLPNLPIPFLYVCGARDLKFSAVAHRLTSTYRVTAEIIANAGHNAHSKCPAVFAQVLHDFLRKIVNQ